MKASNQAKNRETNRNLILKLIIQNSPISRIELSKITNLTKMTVTNIVNELIDEGIVQETEKMASVAGRSPIALSVIEGCRYVVGVYIFRRLITSFIGDLKGNISMTHTIWLTHDENYDSVEKIICQQVDRIMNNVPHEKIVGIGVSSIGPVNSQTGVIINPPDFYGIENLPVKQILEDRYHMPVFVEQDMSAAALAERYFGNAKHVHDFIYFGITSNVSAGVVINDKLFSNETGFSGEIGHTSIDFNGPKCSCGNNGCLELYAALGRGFDDLGDDEKYLETQRICKYLAIGCVTMINMFNPEVIYFGHDFRKLNVEAINMIKSYIDGKYLSRKYRNVRIELSKFGNKAGDYGALANFIDKMVF